MNAPLRLLAWFRKGSARRSASRSLYGLSRAQLADLGIPPDRIDDVVDEMLMLNEHQALRSAPAAAEARRPTWAMVRPS